MIDITKIETASDIGLKKVLKAISKLKKYKGYDRTELLEITGLSKSQWEHYSLNRPLKKYCRTINGRNYYFNPKYL